VNACPNCGVDNRAAARFCRNCGIALDAAPGGGRRKVSLPPTGTLLRIGGIAVGVAAAIVLLALFTGGGDDAPSEVDTSGSSPESVEAQIRAPADVDLAILDDTCAEGACRATLTFTDRSEGESENVARFVFNDQEATRQPTAGNEGTGDTGRIVESLPVDDPVCVSVRAEGGGDTATSDRVCRMAVETASGPRLVDAAGLVRLIDLDRGRCARAAEGQDPSDQGAWFRVVSCGDGAGVKSFFRESPTNVTELSVATPRCAQLAQDNFDPAFRGSQAFVGEGRDGRPALNCIWRR
jgi:hypothetical protein